MTGDELELPPGHTYSLCDPAVGLCNACLRLWLNRRPPPPATDERAWEEFELAKVAA